MNGFCMRLYRNMKSRVLGIQKPKAHLYAGISLLSKEDFYSWIFNNKEFYTLFEKWEISGYDRRLTPSVDRIDSNLGYEESNMRIVPFCVNCANVSKENKSVATSKFVESNTKRFSEYRNRTMSLINSLNIHLLMNRAKPLEILSQRLKSRFR